MNISSTESLCRICLGTGATIPIFGASKRVRGSESSIQDQLALCLNEKLEDVAGYPRHICDCCQATLNTVCTFINKYRETCEILQKSLEVIVKQENTEDYDDFIYIDDDSVDTFETKPIKKEIKIEFEDGAHFLAKLKPLCNLGTNKIKESKNGTTKKHPVKKNSQVNKKNCVTKKNSSIKKKAMNKPLKLIKKKLKITCSKAKSNRIASSLLEGNFVWNGEDWSYKEPSDESMKKEKEVFKKPQEQKQPDKQQHQPKPATGPPDPVLCETCGETFKTKERLKQHEERKHKNSYAKCPICNLQSVSEYYLKRHMKRKHSEVYDFMCSICGRGFAFKGELMTHTKVVHEKNKREKVRVKCNLCDKDFCNKKVLLIHERSVHTGERPAKCTVCDTSFFHDDYLKEHMRLHTGECPYSCPVCGRAYAQLGNMKSHMRNHRISDLDYDTLRKVRPSWHKFMRP